MDTESAPDSGDLIELGNALAGQGDHEAAVDVFRSLVDAGVEVWRNLGNSLWAMGRLPEALAAFDRAIAEGDVKSYRNAGMVLDESGDLAGAASRFEEAFEHADDVEMLVQAAFIRHEMPDQRQRVRN